MKTDVCLRCPHGKEVHPISELVKDSSTKRGYKKMCKPCNNKRNTENWARRQKAQTDNMYATGVDQKTRLAIMHIEMPIWEQKFMVIDHYKLDVESESDSANIERVLALHGLG